MPMSQENTLPSSICRLSLNPIFGPASHPYSLQCPWDIKILQTAPSPTPEGWLLGCRGWGGHWGGESHPSCSSERLGQPLLCQPQTLPSTLLMEFRVSAGFWEAIWLPLGPSLWEHNLNLYFSAKRVNEPPFTFHLLKLQALWSTAVSFLFFSPCNHIFFISLLSFQILRGNRYIYVLKTCHI